MLTISYLTCRENPKIEWFFDSLKRQLLDTDEFKVVVVDFHKEDRALPQAPFPITHVEPKPCHWKGKHRLTREDWFSVSNDRNTALCLAPDGHIVFVDDLSVLMPGWMNSVREMARSNYVVCGAYHKVKDLVVENGEVKSYTPHALDHRFRYGSDSAPVPCEGGWMYGCSCGGPVDAFLNSGGFPEAADSLSSEDYCMGIAMSNAGVHLKYDRRMMTLESEELHHIGKVLIRRDKGPSGPSDKSHAMLSKARSVKHFDNWFDGGIRKLREDALSGKPFPLSSMPETDWYDGMRIADFTP